MTRNTVVKIDLILHATEDFQKIADPLNDLFAIEREEITKQEWRLKRKEQNSLSKNLFLLFPERQ